jgi:hypothetical protein
MIHLAGELSDEGVQRCARCGVILTDYRNSMVPAGTSLLSGWPFGARVEVFTGNPKYSGLTQHQADCETLQ